jgi:hypothetical protein
MTYDPVDSDTDGTVEADVDNQSTTADDATFTNSVTDPAGNTLSDLSGGGASKLSDLSDVYKQSTTPSSPSTDDIWFDTS